MKCVKEENRKEAVSPDRERKKTRLTFVSRDLGKLRNDNQMSEACGSDEEMVSYLQHTLPFNIFPP